MNWNAVDWTRQNRDIAAETGCTPGHVSAMRKKLRQPKPSDWHKPKTHAAMLKRWSKVDWRMSNAVVARQMQVSPERARRMRKLLKQPKATIRSAGPSVNRVMRLIAANLPKLRGLSVARAERLLGCILRKKSTARRYLDGERILRDGKRKHPWHLMNFALGNDALARIWGMKSGLVAKYRYQNKGKTKVQRLSFARPHNPAYLHAISREESKVRKSREDSLKSAAI